MNKDDYIIKDLRKSIGGGQTSKLYLTINPSKEDVKVCVSLDVTGRFKLKDIEKANKLYEAIQDFCFDLEEIVYGEKIC